MNFSSFHEYAEEKFGGPVWTHQFADKEVVAKLKELSKEDFIQVMNSQEEYSVAS